MMNLSLNDFGIAPDTLNDATPALEDLLNAVASESQRPLTISCQPGTYHFYPEQAARKVFYVSNHDQQDTPRNVAFLLEGLDHITVDGNGADFIFHGTITPFAIMDSSHITLKNLNIDYAYPQIHQFRITAVDPQKKELTGVIDPYEKPIIRNTTLTFAEEDNPTCVARAYMSFHPTGQLIPGIADRAFKPTAITQLTDGSLRLAGMPTDYQTGDILALRPCARPTPACFLSHADQATLENITIHYAFGMGVLVQNSKNPTLDHVSVARRGKHDHRVFTTQADATHFVGCSGKITSVNGLYEGMADDAINVHGVYLSVTERLDVCTCKATYMHEQCYGMDWAEPGDTVTWISPKPMQGLPGQWTIKDIRQLDTKNVAITFDQPLPKPLPEGEHYGIENLNRTPEVCFSHNTVRYNRARGALFTTPKTVICEDNFFDHSHGSAILLCGDCNGWYESGACNDVIIRRNHFRNCLTAKYQFTAAIISIYPEIPDIKRQTMPLHGQVTIEDNLFETFPSPLLYAKSVANIDFLGNRIWPNWDYQPLFPDKKLIILDHVANFEYQNNQPIITASHIQHEE